ncbi:MAG: hypothetical protein JWL62_3046 [Hyphomicrobiales bacterium]|nr:hypothetical protein [Hyphomicrobiales bacterium]
MPANRRTTECVHVTCRPSTPDTGPPLLRRACVGRTLATSPRVRLGLWHVRGMLPIALVFLAVVWAEKVLDWTTVAFYWLAIILLRTMATNVADFAHHDSGLSYPVFVALLIAFMAAMIWVDKLRSGPVVPVSSRSPRLPATDWSYWALMLAAGVLGTALGDWIADAGLGVYWASLIVAPSSPPRPGLPTGSA